MYKNFEDDKIKVYFYNHIHEPVFAERYVAIPIIYCRVAYFNYYYNFISPTCLIPFHNKKFCLIATKLSHFTPEVIHEKNRIANNLQSIGPCDHLHNVANQQVKDSSCYHSQALLNLFQEYKFVFVSENSITEGYITEKIFNCFFARCIPIYFGSNPHRYFNKNGYIDPRSNHWLESIRRIASSEEEFNAMIDCEKISDSYDDEDFEARLHDFMITNSNHPR